MGTLKCYLILIKNTEKTNIMFIRGNIIVSTKCIFEKKYDITFVCHHRQKVPILHLLMVNSFE